MCELRHDVCVLNYENNEVIQHEIVLVRGIVTQRCDVAYIIVQDLISGIKKDFDVSKSSGDFKILWCLTEGVNQLKLSYCRTTIKLNLNFKVSETEYKIQPLYLICKGHDGTFNTDNKQNTAEEACKKITLSLKLVQCLYSEKLFELGLGRKTFTLRSDCITFHSTLDASNAKKLDENLLWDEFAHEIINSKLGDDEKLKFVAFIGCTEYTPITNGDYSYSNIKQHTKAHANLGGGGLALFGSGCLYSWPSDFNNILSSFENKEKINLEKFLDDSNYRRTYGGCYATTIGAVCHEIGHIFDLGHTAEGIMGNGFDYVNLVFTNNNRTEILPNRLVDTSKVQAPRDKRLTSLKAPGNFLQKYHEQKSGDSTFFTRSCGVILCYHKWLNMDNTQSESVIQLNDNNLLITCEHSYIKLIEIREKMTNLVVDYLDLSQTNVNTVDLSKRVDLIKHSLFVITANGSSKLFA